MSTATDHRASPRLGRRLLRNGILGTVAAAVATVGVAAWARAADVSLEVDGTPIPLSAFAFWTFVAAVAGGVVAVIVRNRRQFVVTTVVATALSLIPAVLAPDDSSTTAVLLVTHVIAAAILIPILSRPLRPTSAL